MVFVELLKSTLSQPLGSWSGSPTLNPGILAFQKPQNYNNNSNPKLKTPIEVYGVKGYSVLKTIKSNSDLLGHWKPKYLNPNHDTKDKYGLGPFAFFKSLGLTEHLFQVEQTQIICRLDWASLWAPTVSQDQGTREAGSPPSWRDEWDADISVTECMC